MTSYPPLDPNEMSLGQEMLAELVSIRTAIWALFWLQAAVVISIVLTVAIHG